MIVAKGFQFVGSTATACPSPSRARVDTLIRDVQQLAAGVDHVYVPGEIEHRTRTPARGIPLERCATTDKIAGDVEVAPLRNRSPSAKDDA